METGSIRAQDDEALAAIRSVTSRTQGISRVTAEALARFLERQPDLGGRLVGIELDTSRRASGASSGTQLLDAILEAPGRGTVRRPLVFRYDLGGTFFFQYDLIAQFKVMRALDPMGIPVPKALWLDAEGEIAARPGLFMARVDAPAPGGQAFAEGPIAEASPELRHAMILSSVRCFADIHKVDAGDPSLAFLNQRGQGAHFIDRAVDWDTKELLHAIPPGFGGARVSYYDGVRDVMLRVRDHLLGHAPRARKPELVHGDTNLSNVMFHGSEVAALLDWELCHFGLGEGDLGYCFAGMSHFLSTLPPMEGVPSEEEIVAAYRAARGRVEDFEYGRLWGEWRLGVYQVMAYSRFSEDLRHIEEMYWARIKSILGQFVPL
jgi:aminoglycoside phosphotransferase (APT) family kinase protein